MVSKNTVDEDIYKMQEKKVKMNAAIMESSNSASTESKDKKELLQSVVDRFMKSPEASRIKTAINRENDDDDDEEEIDVI
jgi:hypothetical protein